MKSSGRNGGWGTGLCGTVCERVSAQWVCEKGVLAKGVGFWGGVVEQNSEDRRLGVAAEDLLQRLDDLALAGAGAGALD